jgi:hypothetical protein
MSLPRGGSAIALARAAQGPEAVDHARIQPDQPLALLVDLVLEADAAERERGGDKDCLPATSFGMRRLYADKVARTSFRGTRDVDGQQASRTELSFDGIAGYLRVPTGGSSRRFVVVIANGRLLSPREAARLGAP